MRFFLLQDDVHVPGRWHLGEALAADGTEPRLRAGIRYGGLPLSIAITHNGIPLDYCLTSFAVPVARQRVSEVVASVADDSVQRIPLTIDGLPGFEVLNALRVVSCLDEEKSEFVKWTEKDGRPEKVGAYRGVTRLMIDPSRVPQDAHIFRIEGWLVALVVSERIKDAMESVGCIGAKFEEVVEPE